MVVELLFNNYGHKNALITFSKNTTSSSNVTPNKVNQIVELEVIYIIFLITPFHNPFPIQKLSSWLPEWWPLWVFSDSIIPTFCKILTI